MTYNQKALKQYQSVNVHSSIEQASPHKLISMLLEGLMTAVTRAKGLIQQKDLSRKTEQINKATDIIIHLQSCLDHEKGGEVSANLDALYTYMLSKVIEANRNNDEAVLAEVMKLVAEVKAGWEEMPNAS